MKYVIVRFDIEDAEMEQAHIEYSNEHNGRKAPSDKVAFARDLQAFAYDDGGMHGSFEVLHVGDLASVDLDRMARLLKRSLPFVIPQNTSLAEEIREVIEGHTFALDGAE